MKEKAELRMTPEAAASDEKIREAAARALHISPRRINDCRVTRRSLDCRRGVVVNLTVLVATDNDKSAIEDYTPLKFSRLPDDAPQAVVVGAGPAGLFAALQLILDGIKPVVLERGKDVDRRRLDIASLNRSGIVDPDSNYCFGEGGAGTFSDGKLFTRSKKRGNNAGVLQLLVDHGASHSILCDAHPHIGSDRLPHIIKAIRHTIEECGGEVRFDTRAERLVITENADGSRIAIGVEALCKPTRMETVGRKEEILGIGVILATGHSARDTIRNLHAQGVEMEAKGFAMGVRLEHPAVTIDRIQYHNPEGRGKWLPAAEYNFVTQADGRGVYSFCMCPGGVVVPAVSGPQQSVVNGMSASARAGRWSNSGLVVEIRPGDFPEYEKYGVFQLLQLQEDLERKYFESAGESLKAPAQRMRDFLEDRLSADLPATSYIPGLVSRRLKDILPPFIAERLRKGFRDFNRKANGFLTDEAVMIGLESRTSSPVRIPRDRETYRHVCISGLYPAGEGAGYAGGIVSAAVDGMLCAKKLSEAYSGTDHSSVI